MGDREDVKFGRIMVGELFIGEANSGLGVDVTAELIALAGGGSSGDLTGDIYSDDGLVKVFENGTDGTNGYLRGANIFADNAGNILLAGATPAASMLLVAVKAMNFGNIIDSIATPGNSPATVPDTRITFAHLVPQEFHGGSGVWDGKSSLINLGSGVALTGFTPQYLGQRVTIYCADSTVDATVTCGGGVTFDGTNDVATFADDGDAIEVEAVSLTRWLVKVDIGTVLFT